MVGTVIIIVALLSFGIASFYYHEEYMSVEETKVITVSEKWIKSAPNSEKQYYMVADTDFNVYVVKDQSELDLYNSSNRYAQLQPGKTYNITTIGIRSEEDSEYPNIIRIELVK